MASDYLEGQIRAHQFRTATWAKPTHNFVALWIGDPTDTGSAGAEVSGGSYARQDLPPADANWSAVSATDGITKNLAAITFPAPTANWGTITHAAIFDAVSGGNMIASGALSASRVVNNGDAAPTFPINAIVVTVS